ncbi:FAD dependent oxidoreductase [Gongronella butleri]|nr:FAD dependent oxidoreductase [Gongronella butleri]
MYTAPQPGSTIIIVGGGCYGLSTAHALALKRKYKVIVFDKEAIPACDAASTDINKAVRYEYGDNLLYMHLTMEALPYWHQWNKERAESKESPVFHQSGVLLFGRNGKYGDYERKSIDAVRAAGYGHAMEELVTPEQIIDRFPQFENAVHNGYNVAYFNKDGGWCNSAEAIKHVYGKCVQEGVQFVTGAQRGAFESLWLDDKEKTKVRGIVTKDGTRHAADTVMMATGAWTAGLVPGVSSQLQATGQVVVQFKPKGVAKNILYNQPVWAADVANTGYYGFPMNEHGTLKIARHACGFLNPRQGDGLSVPRTQANHPEDTIPLVALRRMRQFLAEFLPVTSPMDITYSRMCWYSDSPDGDFLICPHPDYSNLIIASGDSGHAMKMLPVLGYKIRNIVEGMDSDYARAWAWRTSPSAKMDEFRGGMALEYETLGVDQGRMASPDDFLAAKQRL